MGEGVEHPVEGVVLDPNRVVVVLDDPGVVVFAADEEVVVDVGVIAGDHPLVPGFEDEVVGELAGDPADRPGAVHQHVVLDRDRTAVSAAPSAAPGSSRRSSCG